MKKSSTAIRLFTLLVAVSIMLLSAPLAKTEAPLPALETVLKQAFATKTADAVLTLSGDTGTFSAALSGYDGLTYTTAWQKLSAGEWETLTSSTIAASDSVLKGTYRLAVFITGAPGAAPGAVTVEYPVRIQAPAPAPTPVTETEQPEAEPKSEPVVEVPVAEQPAPQTEPAPEPVVEEIKQEEPQQEEPQQEEPEQEEPAVVEEPVEEEPAAEEIVADEPAPQPEPEPVADEPVAEEALADEPAAEEPEADEPAAEEPAVEEPAAEEPAAEEPAAEEPVVEETPAEEPAEEPVAEEADEVILETEEPIVPDEDPEVYLHEALTLPEDAQLYQRIVDALNTERTITIYVSWDGQKAVFGSVARLIAVVEGYDDVVYTLQWQRSVDGVAWEDVPGANGANLKLLVTPENYLDYWRVSVIMTDVKAD